MKLALAAAALVALSACSLAEKPKKCEDPNGYSNKDECKKGNAAAKPTGAPDHGTGDPNAPGASPDPNASPGPSGGDQSVDESGTDLALVQGIDSIAVLGDSISTGILADTKNGEAAPDAFLNGIHQLVPDISDVAGLLSGSQTIAIADVQAALQHPELTAISGDQDWSHKKRLAQLNHADVHAENLAVAGATIADAADQVAALQAKYDAGQAKAKYIVVEFGANDLLSTDADAFYDAYKDLLDDLAATHPEATIAALAIPSVPKLFELLPGTSRATSISKAQLQAIWGFGPIDLTATCAQTRAALGVPTGSNAATTAGAALAALNAKIKQAVDDATTADGPRIVYVEAISDPDLITKDDVALDCYHPNAAGQRAIADAVWKALFVKK
jgi:lysophospholipase L1-like esterase